MAFRARQTKSPRENPERRYGLGGHLPDKPHLSPQELKDAQDRLNQKPEQEQNKEDAAL